MYTYNRKRKIKILLLILLVIGSIGMGIGIFKMYDTIEINTFDNDDITERVMTILEKEEEDKTIVEMLEDVMPTIVGISKIRNNGTSVFDVNSTSELGLGSGVIISKQGYILTNEHVSGGKYSTCYVTLENGEILNANVAWSDENLDLSIIKVNKQFTYCAELGDSNNIKVGETVYAIGNPIGVEFQRTVTSGIISALDRTITFKENQKEIYMDNLIQTDATINPGNSGGPLLNIYGQILGINTVKITSAEGIGFAVPTNIIRPILESFENDGNFEEASIGILAYDKNVIPYLNSNIKFEQGIYVENVINNSSAYEGGLRPGDIIIQIDDRKLNKMSELKEYIYSKKPGDEVSLKIIRNNKNVEISIRLKNKV